MHARRLSDLAIVTTAIAVDLVAWNGDRELRSGDQLAWPIVPALAIVVHCSLFWRHRRPGSVFAIQLVFALCCSAIPQFQAFAGLMVALFVVAARFSLLRSVAALALTLAPFALHTSAAAVRSLADGAQLMILWAGLSTAVWGVGRFCFVAAQRDRLLREQRAQEAVDAERRRLARELHDTVSHGVTTMIIQAAGSRAQLTATSPSARTLEIIEQAGVQAMTELHRMLGLLEGPSPNPSLDDLGTLIESARTSGRRVDLSESGTKIIIGSAAESAVYRMVQESLTNTLKYAGPTAPVIVGLQWDVSGLRVDIVDHGPREAPESLDLRTLSAGTGLAGLRSRIEGLGGTMRAGPVRNGFTLTAHLPSIEPTRSRLVPHAA